MTEMGVVAEGITGGKEVLSKGMKTKDIKLGEGEENKCSDRSMEV